MLISRNLQKIKYNIFVVTFLFKCDACFYFFTVLKRKWGNMFYLEGSLALSVKGKQTVSKI